MNRFRKILFIADGSSGETAALEKILGLARDSKASVCLMDVVEPYPDKRFLRAGLARMSSLHTQMVKARKAELKDLLARCRKDNTRPRSRVVVREGKAHVEIIRQVIEGEHDLVVKASSGNPRINGMRLGALDMSLLRKCPCPVLVMKPARRINHSRILAAVDLTHLPEDEGNLDREIMDLASALAVMEESKLHLLHAWHMPYENIMEGEARVKLYKTVPRMLRELRAVENRHLKQIASLYPEANPQIHMIKGVPEKVIPAFAEKKKVDLIVMGTLARAGVEGLLIGNTAEKILSRIDCSVLALKPEGFVSPITP